MPNVVSGCFLTGSTRGVIPGGAGGAVAPQLLANNTFFRVFTHHRQKGTIRSGVNGLLYVSHMVMSDKSAIFQLKKSVEL